MKLKKIFAGTVAGALAVGSLAASVSAGHLWTDVDEKDPGLSLNNGMYLVQLYNTGNEAENKPAVDYGLDLNAISAYRAYVQVMDSEDAAAEDFDFSMGDGGFGGGFIYSANGDALGTKKESDIFDEATNLTYFDKYNWPSGLSWWGLPHEEDSPDKPKEEKQGSVDYWDQYTYAEYIDKLHYRINCALPEEDNFRWPSVDERKGNCYQIGMQEWSQDNFHLLKVNLFVVFDGDNNPMIAFDEKGTPIQDTAEIQKMMDELDKPQQSEAPANTEGESSAAPEESGDAASTSAANTSAPATSAAPTTTAAQSSSNSSSNNTGLIIGIIAAVVVVVVVVVIIVIKKKKS